MKYISIIIGLVICFFAFQQYQKKSGAATQAAAPVVEPPPPPAILEEPPPPLDMEAIRKIRNSTRDTNPQVRWEAVQLLINMNDPDANRYLFNMLHQDTEQALRVQVVGLLQGRGKGDTVVVKHLLEALSDTDPQVRLAVLSALSSIGDYKVSPQISRLIHDVDESVRLAALNTLNELERKHKEDVERVKMKNQKAQKEYEEKMRQFEANQQQQGQ